MHETFKGDENPVGFHRSRVECAGQVTAQMVWQERHAWLFTLKWISKQKRRKCLACVLKFPLRGSVSLGLYIQPTAPPDYFSIEDKSHIRFVNRICQEKNKKEQTYEQRQTAKKNRMNKHALLQSALDLLHMKSTFRILSVTLATLYIILLKYPLLFI